MAMKKKKATVVHDEEEDLELLGDAIIQVAEGIKKLRASRLKESALLLLIHSRCPMRKVNGKDKKPTRTQIQDILDAAEDLPGAFLKKR